MHELREKQKEEMDAIKKENKHLSNQYAKMMRERDQAQDENQYQRQKIKNLQN